MTRAASFGKGLALALVATGWLGACGGKHVPSARGSAAKLELSEEELFARGEELLGRGKHDDARTYLRLYEQRYPRGPHIEETKLMIADTFFRSPTLEQRVEGVALYRQFLTYYPKHALSCVAQFRIADYHFEQMRSCERDQSETRLALEEFQKLLATYPECSEAEAARQKLQQAYDRLACAEFRVAEFYLRTGNPRAAEHRLSDLLRDYPSFELRCEALALHVEVLERLGEMDRAHAVATRMTGVCAGKALEKVRKLVPAALPLPEPGPDTPVEGTEGGSRD